MKHAKIFIGCLMIILTSCSINEKSAPKTVTGTLVPGHEVRSFSELTVEEAPQMPDGFGADYDGTYNVLKIASITPLRVSLSGSRTEPVPGLPRRNRGLAEKRRPGVFHQYGNTAISKMAARRKQTHFVGKKHRQPSNN